MEYGYAAQTELMQLICASLVSTWLVFRAYRFLETAKACYTELVRDGWGHYAERSGIVRPYYTERIGDCCGLLGFPGLRAAHWGSPC